jgi:hypothetical protein
VGKWGCILPWKWHSIPNYSQKAHEWCFRLLHLLK